MLEALAKEVCIYDGSPPTGTGTREQLVVGIVAEKLSVRIQELDANDGEGDRADEKKGCDRNRVQDRNHGTARMDRRGSLQLDHNAPIRCNAGTDASLDSFGRLALNFRRERLVEGTEMSKIVVVTGAGAGVGRACVEEFAKHGCDVALLSRDPDRLDAAAERRQLRRARASNPDRRPDAAAVEAAAIRAEQELGPIDVWVNVAMATVFAPVHELTPEEFQRGTQVTYLGQVHGTMAALKRMRARNRGTIVNVGSALAYRSVPLQSVYCGAKFAVRGFTDSCVRNSP